MVRFGPSGNSDSFYEQGYKSSLDAPAWLAAMGLDAYEYSCTRGIRISADMAARLGERARQHNIKLSIHAPYFINLASEDSSILQKSRGYIEACLAAARNMGADRIVFHPGSPGKARRRDAFENVKRNLTDILEKTSSISEGISLCPETMGKKNQIGTLDEILELCQIDSSIIPTLDFGHLHAIGAGALNSREDYRRVFERLVAGLGRERASEIHIHYSRVEFSEKSGEKRHCTYDDAHCGPEFEPLAECLSEYGISATIISESRGTMAEDSLKVKNIYERIRADYQE